MKSLYHAEERFITFARSASADCSMQVTSRRTGSAPGAGWISSCHSMSSPGVHAPEGREDKPSARRSRARSALCTFLSLLDTLDSEGMRPLDSPWFLDLGAVGFSRLALPISGLENPRERSKGGPYLLHENIALVPRPHNYRTI